MFAQFPKEEFDRTMMFPIESGKSVPLVVEPRYPERFEIQKEYIENELPLDMEYVRRLNLGFEKEVRQMSKSALGGGGLAGAIGNGVATLVGMDIEEEITRHMEEKIPQVLDCLQYDGRFFFYDNNFPLDFVLNLTRQVPTLCLEAATYLRQKIQDLDAERKRDLVYGSNFYERQVEQRTAKVETADAVTTLISTAASAIADLGGGKSINPGEIMQMAGEMVKMFGSSASSFSDLKKESFWAFAVNDQLQVTDMALVAYNFSLKVANWSESCCKGHKSDLRIYKVSMVFEGNAGLAKMLRMSRNYGFPRDISHLIATLDA